MPNLPKSTSQGNAEYHPPLQHQPYNDYGRYVLTNHNTDAGTRKQSIIAVIISYEGGEQGVLNTNEKIPPEYLSTLKTKKK